MALEIPLIPLTRQSLVYKSQRRRTVTNMEPSVVCQPTSDIPIHLHCVRVSVSVGIYCL